MQGAQTMQSCIIPHKRHPQERRVGETASQVSRQDQRHRKKDGTWSSHQVSLANKNPQEMEPWCKSSEVEFLPTAVARGLREVLTKPKMCKAERRVCRCECDRDRERGGERRESTRDRNRKRERDRERQLDLGLRSGT